MLPHDNWNMVFVCWRQELLWRCIVLMWCFGTFAVRFVTVNATVDAFSSPATLVSCCCRCRCRIVTIFTWTLIIIWIFKLFVYSYLHDVVVSVDTYVYYYHVEKKLDFVCLSAVCCLFFFFFFFFSYRFRRFASLHWRRRAVHVRRRWCECCVPECECVSDSIGVNIKFVYFSRVTAMFWRSARFSFAAAMLDKRLFASIEFKCLILFSFLRSSEWPALAHVHSWNVSKAWIECRLCLHFFCFLFIALLFVPNTGEFYSYRLANRFFFPLFLFLE